MPAVFVTGATGIVGSAVVEHLLARGEEVIAGVRPGGSRPGAAGLPGASGPSEASGPSGASGLPVAAEARAFEFGAPAAELRAALEGADRLFLMRPPAIEDVRTYLFPVIDAARERGIRQIVFLSLQGVQANRRTPHHAVEQYLRETHAPYTLLRPNFFMQNLSTTYAAEIREQGRIVVPAGRSHTAFIDARDIGRVAATVFTEPGHTGRAYTLSGEQSLTYAQIARIMSEELGREIVYARPSEAEYLAKLAADGWPDDYIAVQKMIYRVVRFNVSAFPNRAVRKLTGEPATTFRQFVRDTRAAWA